MNLKAVHDGQACKGDHQTKSFAGTLGGLNDDAAQTSPQEGGDSPFRLRKVRGLDHPIELRKLATKSSTQKSQTDTFQKEEKKRKHRRYK
jgi:hypothetical protein